MSAGAERREIVRGLDDPRVADYRNLRDPQLRAERDLFIVEGRLGIRRLLTVSRFRPRSLFLTETARRALADVLPRLEPTTPIYVTSREVLSGVAGYDVHRGCLAAAERGTPLSAEALLRAGGAGPRRIVALAAVTNPENVGGVFRNALAFGGEAVLLSPRCADPLYRKAIRVSMGASLRLPFARGREWPKLLLQLREAGFLRVALDTGAAAVDIRDVAADLRARERLALVLGSEGEGLGRETLAACDLAVRIPIASRVDSLNVATASGIALHELARGPS